MSRDGLNVSDDDNQNVTLEDPGEHHRHAATTTFTQTNLISDGFVSAQTTDPNLINPWGVAYSSTGAFWISDNGTGLTSIDKVTASM